MRTIAKAPPGPSWPAVAQTIAWGLRPTAFFEWCRRRYGDTFSARFVAGGPITVVSHPDDLKALFALGGDEFESGAVASDFLEPFLGPRSLLSLDGDEHRVERRRVQHAFRAERLEVYRQLVVDVTRADMARWPVGQPFALHDRMRDITLEVILRAVFGADAGPQLDGLRAALGPFLQEGTGSLLVLLPLFRRDLGRRSPWGRFVRQRAAVHGALLDLIDARRSDAALADRTDILSALLQAGGAGDRQLLDDLMTMVLAGHDTTATALAWTFDLLLHHAATMARLRSAVADGEDVYIDAVIQESLRLRPVVGEVARRPTVPFLATAGPVAAGTTLVASIYLAHTDPDRYPSPFAFRPERFLDAAPEPLSWLPFGGGARHCLGAGFANLELREVLRTVVAGADLRAVSAALEKPRRRAVTLVPRHGCRVVRDAGDRGDRGVPGGGRQAGIRLRP